MTETVTAWAGVSFTDAIVSLDIRHAGSRIHPTIAMTPGNVPGFAEGVMTGTHAVKLYIDGDEPSRACLTGGGAGGTGLVTLSGYLVPNGR